MADFDQVLARIQNQLESMKQQLRTRRREYRDVVSGGAERKPVEQTPYQESKREGGQPKK